MSYMEAMASVRQEQHHQEWLQWLAEKSKPYSSKHAAYERGIEQAVRLWKFVLVLSTREYAEIARLAALQACKTAQSRERFLAGWMSVKHPAFIESDRITLHLNIMNVGTRDGYNALERRMYGIFGASVEYISTDRATIKYAIPIHRDMLKQQDIIAFLRERMLNYRFEAR